jgi:hypothetical protein
VWIRPIVRSARQLLTAPRICGGVGFLFLQPVLVPSCGRNIKTVFLQSLAPSLSRFARSGRLRIPPLHGVKKKRWARRPTFFLHAEGVGFDDASLATFHRPARKASKCASSSLAAPCRFATWGPAAPAFSSHPLTQKHSRRSYAPSSLFCGGGGIRTHGRFPYGGFQDRCFRPLSHPSIVQLGIPQVWNVRHSSPRSCFTLLCFAMRNM